MSAWDGTAGGVGGWLLHSSTGGGTAIKFSQSIQGDLFFTLTTSPGHMMYYGAWEPATLKPQSTDPQGPQTDNGTGSGGGTGSTGSGSTGSGATGGNSSDTGGGGATASLIGYGINTDPNMNPFGDSNALNSGIEMSYGTGGEDKMPPPEGLLDERGYKYSKVWILQDGNKVNMYVPVIDEGPGATPQNIDAYENVIRQAWEGTVGKYQVNIAFMRSGYNPSGKILYGTYVYMAEAGKSRSWFYPTNGMMVINTLDMREAAPYEFGHLMFNTLHYDRPHEGYENNVMVQRGGVVEEINITEAINKWGGWYSHGFTPPEK